MCRVCPWSEVTERRIVSMGNYVVFDSWAGVIHPGQSMMDTSTINVVLYPECIYPTPRILNSSVLLRHKKSDHSALCSPICTWVHLAALALLCLMMIMTIWTQLGCHLRRLKKYIFSHFCIFGQN